MVSLVFLCCCVIKLPFFLGGRVNRGGSVVRAIGL
jgi:hypothetical protein